MELKVDIPALAGQDIDPAAFQRVWDRVMPGQNAPRNDGVPDTAVPAQPSVSPAEASETPPVPVCPADDTLDPVPVCPAEPEPPEPTPEPPAVPDCPAECPDCPQCPTCPETPDCPACPQCPETPPEAPALCLGDASQGDSQQLETLMALAQEGAAAGRMLSRRASGSCAKTLSALACDHRLAFRRLSAAYFLITGTRYTPKCASPCLPSSLPLALRQQFVWEQKWEQKNKEAAQATADPCLKELYLELAQEGAFHAGCIRSLLEQMA